MSIRTLQYKIRGAHADDETCFLWYCTSEEGSCKDDISNLVHYQPD